MAASAASEEEHALAARVREIISVLRAETKLSSGALEEFASETLQLPLSGKQWARMLAALGSTLMELG